jgi:hypothetical protein
MDKVLDFFCQKCAEAGPEECALYEKTSDGVKARVEKIFETLRSQPLPVAIGSGPQDYGIVDYGLARLTVFNFLVLPFSIGGKNMSIILNSLERGDGSLLYAAQADGSQSLQCSCDGGLSPDTIDQRVAVAIECTDGGPVNDTLSDLQEWFENNKKQSSFADVWARRVACA